MKFVAVIAALALARIASLGHQEAADAARIPLKNARPSEVMRSLAGTRARDAQVLTGEQAENLPKGIASVVGSDADNVLIVRGTPSTISELREIVGLLDVRPKQVLLGMRLTRTVNAAGRQRTEVVGKPTIKTLNSRPATMTVTGSEDGYAIEMTPRVFDDGTILLDGNLRLLDSNGSVVRSATAIRRVKLGQPLRLLEITYSSDAFAPALPKAGAAHPRSRLTYALSVTPTVEKESARTANGAAAGH